MTDQVGNGANGAVGNGPPPVGNPPGYAGNDLITPLTGAFVDITQVLLETRKQTENQLTLLQRAFDERAQPLVQIPPPATPARSTFSTKVPRPKSYNGVRKDSIPVRQFLSEFTRWSDLAHPGDRTARYKQFPTCLSGSASAWFYRSIRDKPESLDWSLLEEAFLEKYDPRKPVRRSDNYRYRFQQKGEDVETFMDALDILMDAQNVGEEERLTAFLQGLLPGIGNPVLLKKPTTMKLAMQMALEMEVNHEGYVDASGTSQCEVEALKLTVSSMQSQLSTQQISANATANSLAAIQSSMAAMMATIQSNQNETLAPMQTYTPNQTQGGNQPANQGGNQGQGKKKNNRNRGKGNGNANQTPQPPQPPQATTPAPGKWIWQDNPETSAPPPPTPNPAWTPWNTSIPPPGWTAPSQNNNRASRSTAPTYSWPTRSKSLGGHYYTRDASAESYASSRNRPPTPTAFSNQENC